MSEIESAEEFTEKLLGDIFDKGDQKTIANYIRADRRRVLEEAAARVSLATVNAAPGYHWRNGQEAMRALIEEVCK